MSARLRHEMHIHSIVAYWEGREENFSAREMAVMRAVGRLKICTDRDVMAFLRFTDMNSVRPRISELIKEGLLQEVGSTEDVVTGKTVRQVRLCADPRKQGELEFAKAI